MRGTITIPVFMLMHDCPLPPVMATRARWPNGGPDFALGGMIALTKTITVRIPEETE